jgi:hypothetical protein
MMKLKLVILALVVGGSLGIWQSVQEWQARRNPNLSTTEQFISFACDQALADAQRYDHIKLDYSVGSLKLVDEILDQAHIAYAKNPASISISGMAAMYGAYVGEVIRRDEPGVYWTRDSEAAGEKSYPLHWKGESFPLAWCAKRIANGDEDSIWAKYVALRDGGKQQPTLVVRQSKKEAQK